MAVPLVHAEVGVEAVGDGVPGHLPAHPRLQARDVRLRRARGVREGGVAGVQMGEVGDLIGPEGAAAAGLLGPAEHPGFEEGAIDDQLTPAFEQVKQARLAARSVEFYAFSTAIQGIRRRSAASASRDRIWAFSFTSNRSRAASHSCRDTICGVRIAGVRLFGRSGVLSFLISPFTVQLVRWIFGAT